MYSAGKSIFDCKNAAKDAVPLAKQFLLERRLWAAQQASDLAKILYARSDEAGSKIIDYSFLFQKTISVSAPEPTIIYSSLRADRPDVKSSDLSMLPDCNIKTHLFISIAVPVLLTAVLVLMMFIVGPYATSVDSPGLILLCAVSVLGSAFMLVMWVACTELKISWFCNRNTRYLKKLEQKDRRSLETELLYRSELPRNAVAAMNNERLFSVLLEYRR